MIVEYPKFLTEDECNVLIGLGESGKLDHGKISSKKIGYRKAMVRWFGDDEIIQRVKLEVARLSQVPLEKQEEFHFVKYEQSGEYKEHYDGQGRQKTALIYLNQGYSGGETYFPNINRMIKPETGKLIIWDNLKNGEKDKDSLHAGLPVQFGTKYIAVIWIQK